LTAAARALYQEANIIFLESQAQVPIDTGALRASGFVTKPTIKGTTAEVQISYGGAAASYAVIVHEDLEANHPVGKAKYLEDPTSQATPNIPKNVANSVERMLKGLA
jgi:hypothetical protein